MEQDKKEKMDAFWDIRQLVPPKKNHDGVAYHKKVAFANVSVGESTAGEEKSHKLHLTPKHIEKMSENGNAVICFENLSPLIKKVEIHPWKSSYHYYEFFCKNAQAYYEIRGKECARVPFFSYVAQYSQMNHEQLDWYFWWRENVRKSVFLDTDLSYIYLYFYEIINLGNCIDTKMALNSLIEIWHHYRDIYPQLNNALGEWICDYSLLNGLPIPFSHPFISKDMLNACGFREAFFAFDVRNEKEVTLFLLSCCNGYDYRKSKFYDENRELYDEILPQCLEQLLPFLAFWNVNESENCKHISKVAFVGALCSYRVRKHIEVDYIPSSGGEFKLFITSIIKYTENMLRSYLGIRSRLGYHALPPEIKQAIDGFFAARFPEQREYHGITLDYEKLYEGVHEAFSLQKALEIEQNAWNITEKLVGAFEDTASEEDMEEIISSETGTETLMKKESENCMDNVGSDETTEPENQEPVEAFLKAIMQYRAFFHAVVSRDTMQQSKFCREMGIFHESAVDFINEKAVDILGDIVLEESEVGYRLIEDYRELFDTEE